MNLLGAVRRGVLTVGLVLAANGCTVDLNSRTEPLTSSDDLTGQVPLFGVYNGVLSSAQGEPSVLELVADDCGATLSGTISFDDGTDAVLSGKRTGSSVLLETSDSGTKISLTGAINTFRTIEGTWATSDGAGGHWQVTYAQGSVLDHPCPFAENLLESDP
ncbi:MAG: hypothetical protein HUU55_12900 [Myxococcales bacterium]|nr:hypothetical protein [Myxococcales bacterium]